MKQYTMKKWYSISEEGTHDLVADHLTSLSSNESKIILVELEQIGLTNFYATEWVLEEGFSEEPIRSMNLDEALDVYK